MMKWKTRTETKNIGVLELDDIIFNQDYLEVYIDILDMSEELKAEVMKAIEIEKVQYSKHWDELLLEHEESKWFSTKWSDKPVTIDYSWLSIELKTGMPIKYTICASFHDEENEKLDPVCSIDVDLLEYVNELKCSIIKALIDKFFKAETL